MIDEVSVERVGQKDAAGLLGVSDRALRGWEKEDWWEPEFRTGEGYDVPAIQRAKEVHGKKGSTDYDRVREMAREKHLEELETIRLNRRRKEREEAAELNILPLDEYEEFCVELLSVLRHELLGIEREMLKHLPPEVHDVIFVEEPGEPAELQKLIRNAIKRVETRLADGPEVGEM